VGRQEKWVLENFNQKNLEKFVSSKSIDEYLQIAPINDDLRLKLLKSFFPSEYKKMKSDIAPTGNKLLSDNNPL
jgi:hypothetical protein